MPSSCWQRSVSRVPERCCVHPTWCNLHSARGRSTSKPGVSYASLPRSQMGSQMGSHLLRVAHHSPPATSTPVCISQPAPTPDTVSLSSVSRTPCKFSSSFVTSLFLCQAHYHPSDPSDLGLLIFFSLLGMVFPAAPQPFLRPRQQLSGSLY